MRPALRSRLLASLPALLLAAFGCGSANSRIPTHPVQGQVLLDGKPIPHALVILHPLNPTHPETPRPRATVGPDGTFVVETYDSKDGAPAGEYAVTVEWWLSRASPRVAGSEELPPVNRLPARFSKVGTSGLRIRVQEGENQLGPLKLTRS